MSQINRRTLNRGKELKEAIPLLWSQYQHIYEVRTSNIEQGINFLLIVVTFLPVLSVALADFMDSNLFLFPILLQGISFFILLKRFFLLGGQKIPWVPYKDDPSKWSVGVLDLINRDDFSAEVFSQIKAAEGETEIYLAEMTRIIKNTICFMLWSIYGLVLAALFQLLAPITIKITLVYIVLFLLQGVVYWGYLQYLKKPAWRFDERYSAFKKDVKKWLKEHP